MDYKRVKSLARTHGLSVIDLLALAPANDPFYVGSKGELIKGRWFADIYAAMGSPANCHIRRAHYWLVTTKRLAKPDGSAYENTDRDWDFLCHAAKYARYLGLVPITAIVDRRNPPPTINAYHWNHQQVSGIAAGIDESSIIDSIVDNFHAFNPCKTQAYMMEIFCEKSTMNDILIPVCQRYGMNLVTGLGEISITAIYQLALRVKEANKPTRIFYVSDFDPAGECMPVSAARKVEYFMRTYDIGQDVKLIPLALTSQQCATYDLPRAPIKRPKNDAAGYLKRTEKFQDRHGAGATELDALEAIHPGELAKIIEEAIEPYFDRDGWNAAIRKNRELQEEVREYLVGRECEECGGEGGFDIFAEWQLAYEDGGYRCLSGSLHSAPISTSDDQNEALCRECRRKIKRIPKKIIGVESCGNCGGAGAILGRIGENVMADLDVSSFDTWTPPAATIPPAADENSSSRFIYDSSLSYIDQIGRYREQQHQESLSGSEDSNSQQTTVNDADLEEI